MLLIDFGGMNLDRAAAQDARQRTRTATHDGAPIPVLVALASLATPSDVKHWTVHMHEQDGVSHWGVVWVTDFAVVWCLASRRTTDWDAGSRDQEADSIEATLRPLADVSSVAVTSVENMGDNSAGYRIRATVTLDDGSSFTLPPLAEDAGPDSQTWRGSEDVRLALQKAITGRRA